MTWSESDEARKIIKFLRNNIYAPEDLKHNEIRLLRKYYPRVYHNIKAYYEYRHERIQEGEWSQEDEPRDDDWRIKRYENGESIIEPWNPQ